MVRNSTNPISPTKLVSKQKGEHFKKQESKVQNVEYLPGKTVWVKTDDDDMFIESKVISIEGDQLKVDCKGEEILVNLKDCLNSLSDLDSLTVNDLAKIPHANSAVVLKILKERFHKDIIYTYAGKLLVALNPFKKIENLYDNNIIELYKKADTTLGFPVDLDPHTYSVGQCAINGLFNDNKNQSCIVSGESGAGKTETAKQLMNFFAYSKSNLNTSTNVQDIILGSNAVLESFGNAKTINNNNSSRFGKFLKLNLLPTGGIIGGQMSSYMLEISRVEFQNDNERNFHLFYQVLKGLNKSELELYSFFDIKDYNYLNQSNCYEVQGIDDISDFKEVLEQLKKLFQPEQLSNFFKIISGILLCGNVEFIEENRLGVDSAAKISNESIFRKITELFGLDYKSTEKAIIEKVIKIQENTIESPVTAKVAQINIRALSKDLYGFLFQYIIELLNKFTKYNPNNQNYNNNTNNNSNSDCYVGILDIYGFEYFKYNTYEQLLINYANEKLQKYFINNVFASELSLYELEKIDSSSIIYNDNSIILEIFEKKNCGIFPFLYEQCSIESGTSEAFTRSCNTRIKNEYYIPPKGNINEFTIIHTACKVIYNTDEFISKNKHSLSDIIIDLLINSNNELIKDMVNYSLSLDLSIDLSPTNSPTGRLSKSNTKMFVGNKFIKSINELIKCLEETNSHFIRCVKTNQLKQSNIFDIKGVYGQLNSLSILEAIQIIHKGYAYKSSFKDFIKDNQFVYNLLIGDQVYEIENKSKNFINENSIDNNNTKTNNENIIDNNNKEKENVIKMLKLLDIPENEYQIGLTKVFLKKNGWILLEQSHFKFSQLLSPLSIILNSYYNTYINRLNYFKKMKMIIRLQSLSRKFSLVGDKYKKLKIVNELIGFVVVINWLNFEQKMLNSIKILQSTFRMFIQRKKYLYELKQFKEEMKKKIARQRLGKFKSYIWFCVFGLYLQRLYKVSQITKAAIKIQTIWRMHRCVAAYNHMRYKHLKDYAATVVQKNVRCYLQTKNYEFMKYVVPSVILIQSHFRGWLVRRFVDSKVEVFKSIRKRLNMYDKVYLLQNVVRSLLSAENFKILKQDLSILQSYFWTRCWYVEMIRIMWASNTIKKFWKAYKFRKLVINENDELLQDSYKREVQKITKDEIVTSLSLLQNYKHGYLPLHVNVSTKLDEFYPNGWSNSLGMILKVNPDKYVSKISMGLFHTVVVLDELYVYTYGLNDYNQLGYNTNNQNNNNTTSNTNNNNRDRYRDNNNNKYNNNYNKYGRKGEYRDRKEMVTENIRLEPIVMIKEGLKVKDISCGLEHTIMLLDDGSMYSWGLNRNGQCAQLNTYEIISTPTLITFNNEKDNAVKMVSCGNYHVCCLNYEDELFVWGKAFHLGLECDDLFKPTKLNTRLDLKSVYAGKQVSYLLDKQYNLYSFGTTYNGQLGSPIKKNEHNYEFDPNNLTSSRKNENKYLNEELYNNKKVEFEELTNWNYGDNNNNTNKENKLYREENQYELNKNKVNEQIEYKFVMNHIVDISVGDNFTVALDVYGYIWQWGTFLVVNTENDTFEQRTEYTPFIVHIDKQILKSPVAKVSAGWWEVNLLTEELSLYGYNYLKVENNIKEVEKNQLDDTHQKNKKVYKPILFSYPGLGCVLPKDVQTLASPTITVSMIKID